jgi:hypothetical protein
MDPWFFRRRRSSLYTAAVLRRRWTRTASTSPSSSTARHSHMRRHAPAFDVGFAALRVTTTSSRCQRPVGETCRRRMFAAISGPILVTQQRIVLPWRRLLLGRQFFHVAMAQGGAKIVPNRVADHLSRISVTFERRGPDQIGLHAVPQAPSGDGLSSACQHQYKLSAIRFSPIACSQNLSALRDRMAKSGQEGPAAWQSSSNPWPQSNLKCQRSHANDAPTSI